MIILVLALVHFCCFPRPTNSVINTDFVNGVLDSRLCLGLLALHMPAQATVPSGRMASARTAGSLALKLGLTPIAIFDAAISVAAAAPAMFGCWQDIFGMEFHGPIIHVVRSEVVVAYGLGPLAGTAWSM